MTTILIKSFNRPWCLDRCLHSIVNVKNAGKVVVVDDGTDEKYLKILRELYPFVIFKTDPRNKGKTDHIRKNTNLGAVGLWNGVDPNRNWVAAVNEFKSEFMFLHEDDVYTPKMFDMTPLTAAMKKHNISYLDLSGKFGRRCRVENVISSDDTITLYENTKPWSWFAAAFCLYRTEMFTHLYGSGLSGLLQNGNVLKQKADHWYSTHPKMRGAYANGPARVMVSDALPARDPYRGMRGVQQMNDVLSEAWASGQFPWRTYYPDMVPTDEIVRLFRVGGIPNQNIVEYERWRTGRFKEYRFPYYLDGKVNWEDT